MLQHPAGDPRGIRAGWGSTVPETPAPETRAGTARAGGRSVPSGHPIDRSLDSDHSENFADRSVPRFRSICSPIPIDLSQDSDRSVPEFRSIGLSIPIDRSLDSDRSVSRFRSLGLPIPIDRSLDSDRSVSRFRSIGSPIPIDRSPDSDHSENFADRSVPRFLSIGPEVCLEFTRAAARTVASGRQWTTGRPLPDRARANQDAGKPSSARIAMALASRLQ